jgi:hypothetical protein
MSTLAYDPVVLDRDVRIELESQDDEILEFEPLSDDEVHIVISGAGSIGGHTVKPGK